MRKIIPFISTIAQRLMVALEEINGRFGKFTAVPAVQGFEHHGARSNSRSPNCTTHVDEVPSVRA